MTHQTNQEWEGKVIETVGNKLFSEGQKASLIILLIRSLIESTRTTVLEEVRKATEGMRVNEDWGDGKGVREIGFNQAIDDVVKLLKNHE